MSGTTLAVGGLATVGLTIGLVMSNQVPEPPVTATATDAWIDHLQAVNRDHPYNFRYDMRTSGNAGADIYYRNRFDAAIAPATAGPWYDDVAWQTAPENPSN